MNNSLEFFVRLVLYDFRIKLGHAVNVLRDTEYTSHQLYVKEME